MEGRMCGTFPGGPRKSVVAAESTAPARLGQVQQIEERAAQRYVRRGNKRRLRRLFCGFALTVVVSGGVGIYLGLQSYSTLEEVRAELAAERAPTTTGELSSEVNRAMLELWRMEDVEFMRNGR